METLTRVFEFDAAHRVMHERFKCFNLHGHRYRAEVTWSYTERLELGYAVDFKELKRIVGSFIDTFWDHGTLCNPKDIVLIDACKHLGSKYYLMTPMEYNKVGTNYDINPSAENIARELFYVIHNYVNIENVTLEEVKLYETPNCYVTYTKGSFTEMNKQFVKSKLSKINFRAWRESVKTPIEYDARKVVE